MHDSHLRMVSSLERTLGGGGGCVNYVSAEAEATAMD
jgi:hypothetical protein